MLTENLYVHVFALDFSEAFDTIPLSTLMDQMSNLPLHDNILQLDCQFFCKAINTALNFCRICVRYCDWCGKCHPRSDCLGPACYIVAASDLQASHTRNVIIKFADDTYLIVPAANSATCQDELDRVRQWAADNNLQLNLKKSKELLIMSRGRRRKTVMCPRRVLVLTGLTV